MNIGTVLVIGGAGPLSGFVLRNLSYASVRVRALVRTTEDAFKARHLGADEVVIGDMMDDSIFRRALKGVTGVYYKPPLGIRGESETGRKIVSASGRAGICKFVYVSTLHSSTLPGRGAKAVVERALLTSGMGFTILQPSAYMQVFTSQAKAIETEGMLRDIWLTDVAISRVDFRDVAEVAASAFTDDRLQYGTFELCASGNPTSEEVARIAAEVYGHKIEVVGSVVEVEGLERQTTRALMGTPITLESLLNRPPTSLRQFFTDLKKGVSVEC